MPTAKNKTAKKATGQTGPKRTTVAAREEDLITIARMDRLGYTQTEIGKVVGLAQQTISDELKLLKERYKEEAMQDRKVLVVRELNLLMDVRREAFEAWERSKKDAVTTTEEHGSTDKGGFDKETTKTEHPCGNPAYLALVRETSRDVRDLMGLDEAVKIDVSGDIRHHVLDWATLLNSPAANPSTDVEDRLEAERKRLAAIADKKGG